jgi:diguanylate cyclase (GGDEF)-like protein
MKIRFYNIDLRKALPKSVVVLAGISAVAILGYLDYVSGYEISFSIFYLIPISFVALLLGFYYGALVSAISAATWFLADTFSGNTYSYELIPFWNAVMRFGYFLLHSFMLTKLTEATAKAKELSIKDALTGLPNWRYFEEFSSRELKKAKRNSKPLTLCYIDIDNFKNINDTMGHDAGNDVLQIIADIFRRNIRPNDMASRIGGDEFVLLLTETDYENSGKVLLRINSGVAETMKTNNWPVTISMGAVTYNTVVRSLEYMLKQTDELMYQVKKSGKNNLLHKQYPTTETSIGPRT